ncbi:PTS transporter subunit EIIC [Pseudobutyrivibrio xylanivorans]|uniref:PTS system, beta-glucosides-specific IIC component n=1 Tax=Pseudobutyrivibrio xylanivorans TaxID=185007 RepID=A0A1G5S1S3_PSEXY|nr:PTS transporter subunit EIIC [Pseudobutyrivibrio xylanivorans]SCZ80342.1 PTS system, beta-glucosides-specific IIC component [Pseudobutyrivibrio xylanivorans]
MSNQELAQKIIELVGGNENIDNLTHCVTRLRFVIKDKAKVKAQEIDKLDGVLKTLESGGQFQVVLGPKVDAVFEEAVKIVGTANSSSEVVVEKPKGFKNLCKQGLDTLIACFVPAIPVIAGSGMIKVLVVLLETIGVLSGDSSTAQILNVMGDGVFHFLPFFVAFNAAKKMKVDPFLSMVIAAIVLHPDLAALGEAGTMTSLIGLPVKLVEYSAQALPLIFAVWLLKYVDKFASKYSPEVLKVFLRPMIDILVVATATLVVIGPITGYLGDAFMAFCALMNTWGWVAVGINAALFPIMVLTGTHNATIPLLVQMFASQGFDNIFLPSGMAANIAQAGAAAAVAFRSKNKKMKSTAGSATVSALLGITEPALYGVNLRLKKPLIAVLLGAALSGCIIGLAKITAPTFITPSVITAAVFFQKCPSILFGILSIVSAFVIPFIITLILGFEDPKEEE